MSAVRTLGCLLLILVTSPCAADEFRMKNGRIHFADVVKEGGTHVRVRGARYTGAFLKFREYKLSLADVAQRLPTRPAATLIEAFENGKSDEFTRIELARMAWAQGLDPWIGPLLKDAAGDAAIRREFGALLDGDCWKRWISDARPQAPPLDQNAKAAQAALDWLAAHQDEDGRIDADGFMRHDPEGDRTDGAGGGHHGERVPCAFDGAVTGLALMGWLALGNTAVSGPHHEAVARAIPFCRRVVEQGARGFDQIWNHAFCTQALAEAYWICRDATLRPVLEAAVRNLLAMQHRDGGWRYIHGAVSGVPSTAAAGAALGICRKVGIPVPQPAVDRMVKYFEARLDAKTGRSEYHAGAERLGYTPTRANTAGALAALGFFDGLAKRPGLKTQLGALTKHRARWRIEFKDVKTKDGRTVRAQVGYLYPYAWYYTDLALHFYGRDRYRRWQSGLHTALRTGQRQDGAAKGSWDPKGTYSNSAGRAFVTALGALMLLSQRRYPY